MLWNTYMIFISNKSWHIHLVDAGPGKMWTRQSHSGANHNNEIVSAVDLAILSLVLVNFDFVDIGISPAISMTLQIWLYELSLTTSEQSQWPIIYHHLSHPQTSFFIILNSLLGYIYSNKKLLMSNRRKFPFINVFLNVCQLFLIPTA